MISAEGFLACAWWPTRPPATPPRQRNLRSGDRPRRQVLRPGQAWLFRRRRRGPAPDQRQALRRGRSPRLSRLLRQGIPAAGDRRLRPPARPARGAGDGHPGRRAPPDRDPAWGWTLAARHAPARPPVSSQVTVERDGRREAGLGLRRPGRLRGLDHLPTSGRRRRSTRPCCGPWSTSTPSLPRRRDGRGAGPRLERRAAARGGRPWPGGRLQPQGHLGLLRPGRPGVRGRAGRDGIRRRHGAGPPRLAGLSTTKARPPSAPS